MAEQAVKRALLNGKPRPFLSDDTGRILPSYSSPAHTSPADGSQDGVSAPIMAEIASSESPQARGDHTYDLAPLMADQNLPTGWSRKVTQRTMGASAGKYDVYIVSPQGKKFRSKTDLIMYFTKNNLDLNPDDFDFTVRGKGAAPLRKPHDSTTPRKRKQNSSALAVPATKPRDTVARMHTQKRKVKPENVNGKAHSGKVKRKERQKIKRLKSATNGEDVLSGSLGQKLIVKFNFPVPTSKNDTSALGRSKVEEVENTGSDS